MNKGKELAEAHADWLFGMIKDLDLLDGETLTACRRFYVDAMEHGYKHGLVAAAEAK
jgi:hypothetical protein